MALELMPWPPRTGRRHTRRQGGFSMIELMVALLIGIFLLGGLSMLVQNNRRTTAAQSQLARLQDMERVGLGMLTDAIQQAGYYPDPTQNSSSILGSAGGTQFVPGQGIAGLYSAAAPGDWLIVRYATAPNDGILNCSGSSNTTGANVVYMGYYLVSNGQLGCLRETITWYPLVGDLTGTVNGINVINFSVLYGINSTGASQNVDTYKNGSQMTSADWTNISSVQITLTFNNPFYVAPNQGQPATVSVMRTVGVMRQIGI